MNFDISTLNKRRPLWIALSDLFLDNELQEHDLSYIAKKMKESGYSIDEINEILMLEIFPVCIGNLFAIPGGIWTGFDESELVEAIISAKRPNRFQLWKSRRSFWMIKDDWEAVVEHYNSL